MVVADKKNKTRITAGRRSAGGFTLIEMLMSVALIGLIALILMPVYQSLQVRNDADLIAQTIANNFRRAELLSSGGVGDSSWGVYFTSSTITLFQGATYAGRNTEYDELTSVPGSLTLSGLSSVIFEKYSGNAQSVGAIVVSSTIGDSKTININSKGMVQY